MPSINTQAIGRFMKLLEGFAPKVEFMENFIGREKEQVAHIFKQLNIPLPEQGSFLAGTEGGLIFHTDAGVVIRAENKIANTPHTYWYKALCHKFDLDLEIIKPHLKHIIAERFDHEHILQPIASLETDHHIIEIVPGRKLGVSDADVDRMCENLKRAGIEFWDGKRSENIPFGKQIQECWGQEINQGRENSAYLPITTPEFPNGFPVIADRLGAGWVPLFHDPNSIVFKTFGKMFRQPPTEGATIQKKLFAPLKTALTEAWPDHTQEADPEKMEKFWDMCKEFATREVTPGHTLLEAGWASKNGAGSFSKTTTAGQVAESYQEQILAHKNSVRPNR